MNSSIGNSDRVLASTEASWDKVQEGPAVRQGLMVNLKKFDRKLGTS